MQRGQFCGEPVATLGTESHEDKVVGRPIAATNCKGSRESSNARKNKLARELATMMERGSSCLRAKMIDVLQEPNQR